MNWLAIPPAFWTALGYTGGVLAFVAGMLVVRAVRGTPVGWQPICRRCKHDLRGVDPGKGTCPECGADLTTSGAVRTGGRVRRAGAIVVALTGVAVAGTTLWWLTPSRISRIRTDLVASMPIDALVDAALSGVSSEAERDFAFRALDSLLGARSGFPQQGSTRKVPSGELLDALLKTVARAGEPGRTPAAALIEGAMTKSLLQSLDEAERARLLDRAVEEIIASDAKNLDLARIAVASTAWTSASEPLIVEIGDRLRATEAGRAALQQRIVAQQESTAGRLVLLDLQSPLDQLRRNNLGEIEDRADALLIDRAEVLKPAGDSAASVLRVVTDRGSPSFNRGADMPALIADLPPGNHEVHIKGVIVPQDLLTTRGFSSGATTADISFEDALKLEGARPIHQTLFVNIVPPPSPEPPIERVTDADAVAKFTNWLRACRIEGDRMSKGIDFASLAGDNDPGQRDLGFRFALKVRQGNQTENIGATAGSGRGGRSMSGGRLPRSIVATEPFEIVLDTEVPLEAERPDDRSAARALIWARFTLRFANASSRPEVQGEPLPDVPAVATPLAREEARELLLQSIAGMNASSARRRRSRMMFDGFTVEFGATKHGAVNAEGGATQPPLLLTGMFELRSGGSLLAPIQRSFTMIRPQGASIGFRAVEEVEEIYPRIFRYTPNPAYGLARVPTSFRYIAEPFELRFTDAATPPEIVWLKD
ncbi:MAG: hypothetical protein NTU45_02560 [Planctomycetota bacterium]|nr:hypothetical protein [Planctomycetota bacterium]